MTDEDLPTTARQELRTPADAVLTRLVGAPAGTARLREDQRHAIEARGTDMRRAPMDFEHSLNGTGALCVADTGACTRSVATLKELRGWLRIRR